ncbi:MAG: class I SAM-dependent methyltransferase [Alloprevotella sp.]|nr:class I SAM-dependent methyltransferase [Alloprevotella sp.]
MSRSIQGVANTLYIPLVARISVSKKFPEYFFDAKSLELERHIPAEWQGIMAASKEYEDMAAVARYFNLDALTRDFIARHGECNIVHLGAGLDTAYYRIAPTEARFYEVDLPHVAETRRQLLGDADGDTCLGGDLFGLEWTAAMDCGLPTLLIASGVFQYFEKPKVTDFIRTLREKFPQGELVFDATDWIGIHVANWYVRRLGNRDAHMPFYINSSKQFARQTETHLLGVRPFFTDARRILGGKLKPMTRISMLVGDTLRMSKLLHLKLNPA